MKLAVMALPLAIIAFAVPAGAQTAQQDYEAGVAARHAGHPEEALKRLVRAAEAEPDNADIHLQVGFANLALGRLDLAEAAFRRTLELAPGYADARLGLAQVAQRRGERAEALAELDRIGPGNVEADQLRRQIAAAASDQPWRWRIDLDGSYSRVEELPDWQSATLLVQHRPGPNATIGVTADTTRRFDHTDVYGEVRVDYRFLPGGNVYFLAGGTPGADHRPEWQLGAGTAIRVHSGPYATILRLDLRQADYPTGDVQTVNPGVEQYLTGRAWITAQWINVWDSSTHSAGWLLRGDVMPTARLRLFAGAADAPDLDAGVVIRTTSLFGGLSVDVGDRYTLRLSYTHDDPAGSANRATMAIGMGYRF
ncbi:MAG: YaiO family outer membrane beta-barrel protein [Sphingomicrobium sp.]